MKHGIAYREAYHDECYDNGYIVDNRGTLREHWATIDGYANIPDHVLKIGRRAFKGDTYLIQITFPDSVFDIGNMSFAYCISLRDAYLGEGLIKIHDSAFEGCLSLTQITIPKLVDWIGAFAFFGCKSLEKVIFEGVEVEFADLETTFMCCQSLKEIHVPEGFKIDESLLPEGCEVIYEKGDKHERHHR